MRLIVLISSSILAASAAAILSTSVLADGRCAGHQLLSIRRPEASCTNVAPQIFESPNRALRAVVFPVDISLDTTPDMESRVVIRSRDGVTLTSKDHASPRGMNGHYVYRAIWSPDSQFFVHSLVSSGGHSPWSFPIWVFSAKRGQFARFSDMIGDRPTLSGEFTFSGAHMLNATTWRRSGGIEDKIPVTVDLEAAFARLPPSAE